MVAAGKQTYIQCTSQLILPAYLDFAPMGHCQLSPVSLLCMYLDW